MGWNEQRLPFEIEADARDAARRRGAPLPDSAPKIEIGPRKPIVREGARRRVVGIEVPRGGREEAGDGG